MGPTSKVVLAVLMAVAVAFPVGVFRLHRRHRAGRGADSLLVAAVVAAQLAAVVAVFGVVNRQYGFYPTWESLFGRTGSAEPVAVPGLGSPAFPTRASPPSGAIRALRVPARHPQLLASGLHPYVPRGLVEPPRNLGRYVLSTVTGAISHVRAKVNVWLPPQYGDPRYRTHRFPVVFVLSGAYSGDTALYNKLGFAALATAAIQSGKVAPFVAVSPQLNQSLHLDTECVDFPAPGPQSYTWLARDVPAWAKTHLRVSADPRRWSALGWSTGGYCAAKLHLLSPGQFAAAASVEGYFAAEPDRTTGTLAQVLRANPRLAQQSTLGWVVTHHPPARTHLLVATSLADPQSEQPSLDFLKTAAKNPGVQNYVVRDLGHSMPAMKAMTPNVLTWLARTAGA